MESKIPSTKINVSSCTFSAGTYDVLVTREIDRFARSFQASDLDTSDVQQTHIYSLISGGLGGGAAGIAAAIFITSQIHFDTSGDVYPIFPQFMT